MAYGPYCRCDALEKVDSFKIWPFWVSTLDFCTCTFTYGYQCGIPETTHPPLPAFSMTSSQFVNFSYPRTNSQKSAKIQTFPFRVAFLNYPKSSDHFRHPWYQKTTNLRGEYLSGMIFFHIKQKKQIRSTLDPQFCTSFSASELGVPAADTKMRWYFSPSFHLKK